MSRIAPYELQGELIALWIDRESRGWIGGYPSKLRAKKHGAARVKSVRKGLRK
jgi:hypothetical protein